MSYLKVKYLTTVFAQGLGHCYGKSAFLKTIYKEVEVLESKIENED